MFSIVLFVKNKSNCFKHRTKLIEVFRAKTSQVLHLQFLENAIKVYHALRDIFSGPIVPSDAIFIPLRSVQVDDCKYLIFIT